MNAERLNKLIALWKTYPDAGCPNTAGEVVEAIAAAVEAEREACAVLAKSMTGARPREIADAIRARGEVKE